MANTHKHYVYLITNEVNGKVYVGKTSDVAKRWREHRSAARRGVGTTLARAIRKHGAGSFHISPVESCRSEADALQREEFWIRHYGSTDPLIGYNLSHGGESGILTSAARDKISATLKGHTVSQETRAKLRAAFLGRKNPAIARARARQVYTWRKLSDDDVMAIRVAYAAGSATCRGLAAQFGVTSTNISLIVRGKSRADAGGPIVDGYGRGGHVTDANRHASAISLEVARATAHTPEANMKRSMAMRGWWTERRAAEEMA